MKYCSLLLVLVLLLDNSSSQSVLYTFGLNFYGALGLGPQYQNISNLGIPTKYTAPPIQRTAITKSLHSLLLTIDGLYASGYNVRGQLGTLDTIIGGHTPRLQILSGKMFGWV
jgi:alpha-tubulin suppressor-like RCC1 family protein